MAQKKGLIYRLTMGKDNLPDFTPDRLPGTRFQVFKDVFKNRLGALVKVNLWVLLFALPAIAWIVIANMVKMADGSMVPYGGNMGVGYPVITDAIQIGQQRDFFHDIRMYLVLIPLLMIASLGLAGAFYVVRRLAWGEGISVSGHFFRGIKANWSPFLWSSLFAGLSLFLVMFNFGFFGIDNSVHIAFKVIVISVCIIQAVMLLCMLMFLLTQAVTYKLKGFGLIKNSFLFALALLPSNLIMLIISAIPIALLLILPQFLAVFGYFIFALLGFSFIILVWTVYAHWAFDRFINDRVEGAVKNKGMYKKNEQDIKDKEEKVRKNNNIRFNNPKKQNKKMSSIEEGETFTPLSTSFSRADLAKLHEEKEKVKTAIDREYDELDKEDELVEALDTDNTIGALEEDVNLGEVESEVESQEDKENE